MTAYSPLPTKQKVSRLLDPDYPLCREDIIWILEFVKNRLTCADPYGRLPAERLPPLFEHFAEAVMSYLHGSGFSAAESAHWRQLLREALILEEKRLKDHGQQA